MAYVVIKRPSDVRPSSCNTTVYEQGNQEAIEKSKSMFKVIKHTETEDLTVTLLVTSHCLEERCLYVTWSVSPNLHKPYSSPQNFIYKRVHGHLKEDA